MGNIVVQLFIYVIIIMSAIFHEYAHAWTALYLGDPTAKHAGRLTLNPIAHMDLFGTVLLPLFLLLTSNTFIGYAKPVPVNPYNLSDQKYGEAKVAIAGPLSNIFIAIIFSTIIRFVSPSGFWLTAISYIIFINIILALFNLIPVPPLDGSKLLKTFVSFDFSIGNNLIGTILALMLAFLFLPSLASFIFQIFTGISI